MFFTAWRDIAHNLNLSPEESQKISKEIIEKYSEPWRFYHSLEHIEELLALSNQHSHLLSDKTFVDLSIIFHDIQYFVDERAGQNERMSADTFKDLLANHLSTETVDRVYQAIIATKTHSVKETDNEDLKIFMDFDMAILGSPRDTYRAYANKIRQEYKHVDQATYCSARSSFFRNYLSSTENIYSTLIFREQFEQSARDNIAWECSVLESGSLLEEL